VQFNDSGAFGGDAGLTYNKTTDTLTGVNQTFTGLSTLGHIHGNIAGSLYVHIKNTSGVTIAKGTPVYATGSVGSSGEVEVAAADYTNSAKMPSIGITDSQLIANAEGNAVVVGEVTGLATNGYSINQELFVGTAGLLGALPTAGEAQSIAVVSRVHASTGIIVVNAQARLNAALRALANNVGSNLTGITAAQVGALAPDGDGSALTGITADQVGALTPSGDGSALTGITATQVGALEPNGDGSALTGITAAQVGAIADGDTLATGLIFPITNGVRILDAEGDHALGINLEGELTANRGLTFAVNDGNRSVNLSGNLTVSGNSTISGTNTGNQTISLTGDVTGSGTGSFAATIANNAVTYAKIQDVSAASKLIGRGDSGSGDPQEITLGSGLSMSGTTLSATGGGTGTVTSVAISGTDGIEVDSGSPITSAGTIQLGVNAATMKTTLDLAGSNSGDVTLAGTPDYITISGQTITRNAIDLAADVTGTLPAANGGTGVTALGTGVATALGVNVGSAGAFVTHGGALGTPSSGTATNLTGTASGLTAGEATAALGLKTATTTVSVSGATAPTSGQVLTATSSTAATWQTPSAGSGDMVLLASATASGSASITFDNVFDSAVYSEYVLKVQGVQPATDNVTLRLQLRNSTPSDITDFHRCNRFVSQINNTLTGGGGNLGGTTGWEIFPGAGNAANELTSLTIEIQPISGQWTHMNGRGYITTNVTDRFLYQSAGACEGTTVPAGVKVYFSSGNIASGTFYLYGLKK
jgi:hypothetical protein